MRTKLSKGLLCVTVFLLSCIIEVRAQKPWTFLVYMSAANDVTPCVQIDLDEMMNAGSNDKINVIVYLTLHENGLAKVTKKLYVEHGSLTQIGADMVRDSGDVATLEEALQWACVDYPSDYSAVVLWSTGSGPLNKSLKKAPYRGVCYDIDTEHYLTDSDCLKAFAWARDHLREGRKFDIIAFDASFLASLEMAYALAPCAHYLVASQEMLPGGGYHYASFLHQCAMNIVDPVACARCMVYSYDQSYVDTTEYTSSVIDLNALNPLVDNCNAVAQILTSQLKGKNKIAVKAVIKKCMHRENCVSFDEGIYIDLCQFYKNLLNNIAGLQLSKSIIVRFQSLLHSGILLFPDIVKARVASPTYTQLGGLSIYFSRYTLDPSYYGLCWTLQNQNWLNFLEAFLA